MLLISTQISLAQTEYLNITETNYKDFGYKQQLKQAKLVYYKADSLEYLPTMVEAYIFNSDGNIATKYFKILGKYASETKTDYIYKNGLLDSVKTRASSPNFNRDIIFHYNPKNQIVKSHASGVYINYTDFYSYKNNLIEEINRTYLNNNDRIKTNYFYDKGELSYIQQLQGENNSFNDSSYFYFHKNQLFASFNNTKNTITLYNTVYGDVEKTFSQNHKDTVLKLLKIYETKPQDYNRLIGDYIKSNAKIVGFNHYERNLQKDWVHAFMYDNQFGQKQKRYVYKEITYSDGTKSGSTKFDSFYMDRLTKKLGWLPQNIF